MSKPPPEPTARHSDQRWWERSLTWSMLLSAGFLLYEFTADPVLGAVVVSTRFGWQDFLIAYRLYLIDPNRSRMRAMSWLYLASGLVKTGFATLVLTFAGFLVIAATKARFPAIPPLLILAIGVVFRWGWMAGALILFSALTSCCGFWCAHRSSIKVWVDSRPIEVGIVGTARNRPWRDENLAVALLWVILVVLWFLAILGFLELHGGVIFPGWLYNTFVATVFVSLPLLVIGYYGLERRLIASTPAQCWGTDVIGTIMSMKVSNTEKNRWLAAIPRHYWRSEELAASGVPAGDGSTPNGIRALVR